MKYPIDVHTHTTASGHAYTTLLENAKYASEIGLKILGTTDHGPNMPGAPHPWYFSNLTVMDRQLYGVTMLYGCEVNIIDYEGSLDLSQDIIHGLDIVVASLHDPIMPINASRELNTKALLNAMNNTDIHIIGHSGNPKYPIFEEEIVKKAKENDILVEINNSSFVRSRTGSSKNCTNIAKLCKEYRTKIILNSDAHSCFEIGNFDAALEMLKEIQMPDDLIINQNCDEFLKFLKSKGKSINE